MKFYLTIAIAIIGTSFLQLTVAQLISFKDGKIGVNFMGYHAAAGLGGGPGGGFLGAEAGTPFGQAARAGLGGGMDHKGRLGGKLYADATAGEGVGAGAGLGGALDGSENPKAGGELHAGAQAGPSVHAGAGLRGQTSGNGGVKTHVKEVYSGYGRDGDIADHNGVAAIYKSNTKVVGPANRFNADDENDNSEENGEDERVPVKKTYVGAGLGGQAGVPSQPEFITYTKTVQAPPSKVKFNYNVRGNFENNQKEAAVSPAYTSTVTYENRPLQPQPYFPSDNFFQFDKYFEVQPKPHRRPHHHHKHKYITKYYTDVQAAPFPEGEAAAAASGGVNSQVTYQNRFQAGGGGGGSFFDNIFNIPISTLRAVNGFLNAAVPKIDVDVKKTVEINNKK